jgi:hypothetical protein
MKLNFVIKSLLEKEINYLFYLECEMEGDLFIPESWPKVTTWVKEVQFMAMEIMEGKLNRVWCIIECIKQPHEDHKHESLCLTPSFLSDFTCNPRHKLKLDL